MKPKGDRDTQVFKVIGEGPVQHLPIDDGHVAWRADQRDGARQTVATAVLRDQGLDVDAALLPTAGQTQSAFAGWYDRAEPEN